MHLVGFIIRIFHDARSYECQKVDGRLSSVLNTIHTNLRVLLGMRVLCYKLSTINHEPSSCRGVE